MSNGKLWVKVTAETKFGSTQNNDDLPNTASCTGPGTDVSPVPEKSSNSPISAQSMATLNSARRASDNRGVTAMKNNWDCASSRRCYGSPLSVSGSMPRAK